MNKELNIHDNTINAIEFIETQLDKVYNKCLNAPSIKQSNDIYQKALTQAKAKAFDMIHDITKPYVVYQVNKYFLSVEIFS